MFTATPRTRQPRDAASAGSTTRSTAKSTAMLIAVLVMANFAAVLGLGATARADGFPNALHYAPLTWEKPAPMRMPDGQDAGDDSAATVHVAPVESAELRPVAPEPARNFVEVSEEPAPSVAAAAQAGERHRTLLIALMTIALATMGGVSMLMFRSLAREIAETERKRTRF